MTKRIFSEADLYEAVATSPYKNGFRARLRIGERNGKNVYHDVYARSELEVKIKAREFIEKMIAGQEERKVVDSLLSTAFENWLYGEKYGTLKAGSFDRLDQVYRGEILPHISAITLKDCSAADCKKVMDANLARGYSYSTLLKVFRLLREFFRRQHEAGAISYNPMSGIKMYSRDFVRSRQQQAREDKERAITKSSNGQKLAPEELELVLSNLRIAGHRTWHGVVQFVALEQLCVGDRLFLTNPWETLVYEVIETKIITPDALEDIKIQKGRDLLTIFTCTRPNTRRYLLICERVS